MPTFSIMDGMHVRSNPWADTAFGSDEMYLASDPDDLSHLASFQDDLASAAKGESVDFSDCRNLEGMSRNSCRARKISQQLG